MTAGSIAWRAAQPILIDHLAEAAEVVNAVCAEVGHAATVVETGQVAFYDLVGDTKVLRFGYPPQRFIDSLSLSERKALMGRNVSRDGWLSVNGSGTGALETGPTFHAFTVRLFFSVLVRNANGFSAAEEDGENIAVFLRWGHIDDTGADLSSCRDALIRGLRANWFTEDARVRINPSELTDTDEVFW